MNWSWLNASRGLKIHEGVSEEKWSSLCGLDQGAGVSFRNPFNPFRYTKTLEKGVTYSRRNWPDNFKPVPPTTPIPFNPPNGVGLNTQKNSLFASAWIKILTKIFHPRSRLEKKIYCAFFFYDCCQVLQLFNPSMLYNSDVSFQF